MTCKNCGKELVGTPTFCPYCGVNQQFEVANTYNYNHDTIHCPNCGSTNIHFITTQGGTNINKGSACCGYSLCGPLGLLCGVKNEKAKTVRKCMNCGNEF